tara:strand:- start:79 stop:1407 length:1329 start_codon:yes stop_codon:yes gene_type:complete
MKLFSFIIVLFLLCGCSFDDKSGIWKNENSEIKQTSGVLRDFKTITTLKDDFKEIITLDINQRIQISQPINNLEWRDEFYNFDNNLKNFKYNNNNQIAERSKRLSKYKINKNILYVDEYLIINDVQGNIIFYSIKEKKISTKFNFYKKKFKNIKKKINLIIEKDIIYVSDNIGYLYAIDYKTGTLIWAKNYKIPFRSNLKIAGDKLIASNQNNNLFFFNKKNGDIIKFIPTEETVIKNQFINNLSIADDQTLLFLNTYGSLYSVDARSMKMNWFINLNQSLDVNPSNLFFGNAIVNNSNRILVTSKDNTFIIDKNTGTTIKKYNFSTFTKPVLNQKYVFLITKNNLLISIDLDSNEILYSSDINSQIANFLNISKKNVEIKSLMLINNEITIFLKNSYVLNFKINGQIKSVKKLPTKIKSFPILIDKFIYFLNNKKKLIILS